jgi:hypothetical protein
MSGSLLRCVSLDKIYAICLHHFSTYFLHKACSAHRFFRGLGCISHVFLVKTLCSLGDWSCFDKSGCVLVRLDPCREQPSPLAHASYATSQMVRRRELVDRCQVKSLWSATASSWERNARGASRF